jgi:hypothetical protein
MTVFWDVVSCSLVEVDRRFRNVYCLHYQCDHLHDGGSKYCVNVGKLLRDYTAQYPKKTVILAHHRVQNSIVRPHLISVIIDSSTRALCKYQHMPSSDGERSLVRNGH